MPPRAGIPLRCTRCGWRTTRRLENANKKPCPKCGGGLSFDGLDSPGDGAAAVAIIVGAILFMLIFGIIVEVYDLQP